MSSRTTKPANTAMSVGGTASQAGNSTSGVVVKANNHVVEVWADYACWDTVSNKFVNPEDTTLKDPK